MKLIEFKAELITRWYEIAPFSEISIREDDHYGIIVNTRTGMINFLKLQKI